MCKSKTDIDAAEPARNSRTSRTPRTPRTPRRPFDSPRTARSSFTNPSSSYNTSGNYTIGSSYKASSATSISSRTSLSGLRHTLPEKPQFYDLSEICSATNNFSKRLSNATWRCNLQGKDAIIFQRKFRRPIEPLQLRERLASICRGHHVTIIKLLGISISGDHIYLVYEYVEGASLADCLRNPKNPNYTVLSTWISRMQIATDLADGLEYIHSSTGLNVRFVHNHIKSSNVIVTEPSLNARICHFGTAELCGEIPEDEPKEQSGEITEEKPSSKYKRSNSRVMKIEGTRGYMAPEFQTTGIPTQKSDVFAFGVVLLELLSGAEPLKYMVDRERGDYKRISVIETATEAVAMESGTDGEGRIRRWIDKKLNDSFPVDVAEKITRIAVDCVQVEPDKRPDMNIVAGKISKLYLDSKTWSEKMKIPTNITFSLAPR